MIAQVLACQLWMVSGEPRTSSIVAAASGNRAGRGAVKRATSTQRAVRARTLGNDCGAGPGRRAEGAKYIECDRAMTNSTIRTHPEDPDANAGQRLDQALAALLPDYSRSRLKSWIESGEVQVDGSTRRPEGQGAGRRGGDVRRDAALDAGTPAQAMPLEIVRTTTSTCS